MSLSYHSTQEVDSNFIATGSSSMDVALYRGNVTDALLDEAISQARMSPALRLEVHIPRADVEQHRPHLESRKFKVVGFGTTHFTPRYEFVRYGLLLRGQDPTAPPVHPQMRRETKSDDLPVREVDPRVSAIMTEYPTVVAATILARGQ